MQLKLLALCLCLSSLLALPDQWTWGEGGQLGNFLPPVRNQNNPHRCDSGWALATTSALAARINIKRDIFKKLLPAVTLSTQYLLECDSLNYGCLGGEPQQALRWIKENGITDESCNSYIAKGYTNGAECTSRSRCQKCTAKDKCSSAANAASYSVQSVGIIEGEEAMKEHIADGGPIICALTASDKFAAYKEGVLADDSQGNFNHYVSIHGWGQYVNKDNDTVKYWIGQNSYGPNWGEKGHFRIVRGKNALNIESQCTHAQVKDTWSAQNAEKVQLPFAVSAAQSQITPNWCRSSWAFAVLQTVSDIEFVKSNGQTLHSFSVQSLLNCGIGSCDKGGSAADALLFMQKYGIPEEGCQQYQAESPSKPSCGSVDNCASCSGKSIFTNNCTGVEGFKRWRISGYGLVTGGVSQIKRELLNRKALVCGIEMTRSFAEYRGGIFSEISVAPKPDYYVELVSTGSQDGTEYWLGRASLGTSWGINGWFKIKMGSNVLGIESKCYWAGALQ